MTTTKGNENKYRLLGMPYGTACARLRKALLYECASRLGLCVCFQCGEPIEDVESFSIDHKEAWMSANDPVDAFFNLDNIAFSHLSCNIKAASRQAEEWIATNKRRGIELRKSNQIDGYSHCSLCKQQLPNESFSKNRNRYNGLQDCCESCRKVYRNKK